MKTPKSQMIERLVRIQEDRLEHRESDVAERPPGARAVDRGGLDELARHLREPGVQRDDDERQRPPDDQKRHHRELRERRRVPVVQNEVAEPKTRQDVVQDAVLEVRHPVPDLDGDDCRHRPDEHEPGGQQDAHRGRETDEQKGDREAEHHRQADVRRGEDDRPDEGVPEDLVSEHRAVVVEPDPLSLALDQLGKAVALEREDDEPVQRVPEDRADRHEHRQDEEVRHRRAADAAQRQRPPPEPRSWGARRRQPLPAGRDDGSTRSASRLDLHDALRTDVMLSLAD